MKSQQFKKIRKSLGLTQLNLANQLGVSAQQVSNFESGRVPIPKVYDLALANLVSSRRSGVNELSVFEMDFLKSYFEKMQSSLKLNLIMMIAFGSRVTGKASKDSDLDVLIVVKTKSLHVRSLVFDVLFELSSDNEFKISPVIFSLKEFQKNQQLESHFIESIKTEGVWL